MKHRTATATLLGLVLLSATILLAQGRGRPDSEAPRHNPVNFLATVLGLTDDQKQQATTLFDAAEQASIPLRESLTKQRQALNDAAKSNASDVQIDELATVLGDLSGQLAGIRTKAFAKFYAILTADQRTKLDQLHENGRGLRMPGAE